MEKCDGRCSCGLDCEMFMGHARVLPYIHDCCRAQCPAHDRLESKQDLVEQEPLAIFYAIRNQQGQFYRTYSRNSSSGWQDNLIDARLWTKPAGAKSKITALANERPNRPVPELVEFVVREVRVVDQKERVAQSRAKKELEDARRAEANKKWRLEQEQHALERAQQELERAQERVRKLQG